MNTPIKNGQEIWVEIPTERFDGVVIASKIRPATKADVEASRTAHANGKCDRRCFIDVPGFYYDFRECAICGAGMGSV